MNGDCVAGRLGLDGVAMNSGMWLALETSVPVATVAVGDVGGVRWIEEFTSDRSHNSVLFGPLRRALEQIGGLRLEVVLVGTGPGSYGGTRVGIAAGQGVAIARGCPAIGVPSLLATTEARAVGRSLAIGDARRGGWWWSAVEDRRVVGEPLIVGHEEFVRKIEETLAAAVPVVAFDPPARLKLPEEVRGRLVAARPSAANLLGWWAERGDDERVALAAVVPQPEYLRPPHVTRAKAGHPLLR